MASRRKKAGKSATQPSPAETAKVRPSTPPPAAVSATSDDPVAAADAWLGARERKVVLVLFALALLLKVGHVLEVKDLPDATTHLWNQSDMSFFHAWALRLSEEGDWLTDADFHPRHAWHGLVAAQHFERHPEDQARYEAEAEGNPLFQDAAHALWNRWYGGRQFHQAPLYPYLVGITYFLTGQRPLVVFLWQAVLGAVGVVVLYLLTRRFASPLVATIAAVLMAAYGPALHYETTLLRAPLVVVLSLAFAWWWERQEESGTDRGWLVLGVLGGLCYLLKPNLVLLSVGVVAWRAWPVLKTKDWHRLLERPLRFFGIGVVIVLLPLIARNLAVGVGPMSVSSVGAATFVGANSADQVPGNWWATKEEARILEEGDSKLSRVIWPTLATHGSPWALVKWQLRKTWVIVWWFDRPTNTNYYWSRSASRLVDLAITPHFLLALTLPGLFFLYRAAHRCRGYLLLLFCHLLPLLVFYVPGRFRSVLLSLMTPAAALLLVRLATLASRMRLAPLGLLLGAILLTHFVVGHPVGPAAGSVVRSVDFNHALREHAHPEVEAAIDSGDWASALAELDTLLARTPPEVARLRRDDTIGLANIAELGTLVGETRMLRSWCLERLGRQLEADTDRERAEFLFETCPSQLDNHHYRLGRFFVRAEARSRALDHYRKALRLPRNSAPVYYDQFARLLQSEGQHDEMATVLREALDLLPDDANLLSLLGWVEYSQFRDYASARKHLSRALAIQPDHPLSDEYRAAISWIDRQRR
ncbi:MAG: glycosyltransferase family 39 protein [Acidobacteriota bacterium]